MKYSIFPISLLLLFCSLATLPAEAASARGPKKKKNEVTAPKPLSDYEKIFSGKKCTSREGLLTLHDVEGKLFVEMPLSLMDRDVMIGSTVSAVTDNRIVSVGEKPKAPMVVTFCLDGKKVNMCKRRFDLLARSDEFERSLRRNTLLGIISSFDIKAYSPDSTAVVLDMTDMFLGNNIAELNPMPASNPASNIQINTQFKRDLSLLGDIKAFEDNVSIRSRLSFAVTMRDNAKRAVIMADSPFTVEVTRSIVLLPEKPVMPRLADPRIGVFFTKKSVFGDSSEGVKSVFYAQRWRLEPSDSAAYAAGEIVEPIKPIVFYIDDTFPEFWKPYVAEGVERWNAAFEKIGFRNAVRALPYPADDESFDPDNIKYNCVRYSPSEVANSMGPSWTDPRTGEIISASVYIYHNIVKLLSSWFFIQTAPADPSVRTVNIPREILGEGIAYVVAHEVGHCLGLMHNMAGSSSIPVDSLRSASFTAKYGTTYSIMDYARFNYVARESDKGVRLMPPSIGEYDFYAIDWLYRPVAGASTPEDETPVLRRFISERSGNPVYRYGKQQVVAKIDPSSFEEDLGDDPVKSALYGIENLKFIAANIDGWVGGEDPDYSFRLRMKNELVTQYQRYVTRALYNIGGIYLNERFEGDERESYAPVSGADQRRTVNFLLEQTKSLDWIDRMAGAGWPLTSPVAPTMGTALFKTIVQRCGSLWYCTPLMGEDAYSQKDFLGDIASFVWKPSREGRRISEIEMELQSQFISYLMTNSYTPANTPQQMPPQKRFADESEVWGFGQFAGMQGALPATRHICFSFLQDSLNLLKRFAQSSSDADSRAHYRMLAARIEQHLKQD